MAYTDMTSVFVYKLLISWQRMKKLADNDAYLKDQIASLLAYRRPTLKWISVTQVDVENNTSTLNQTRVIFPDGEIRDVTEDTSAANKYRRFDITAAAQFTTGTEDSGVRSGISEATNTWYAIYAVKSTIDSTKFVLAGDTTLPLQTNISTLNTRYGTSGWVYLGLIRNGDNSTATGDILAFEQSGAKTLFSNVVTVTSGTYNMTGHILASSGAGASLTYTYSAGTGAANIPGNISLAHYEASSRAGGGNAHVVYNSAATVVKSRDFYWPDDEPASMFWSPASDGVRIVGNGARNSLVILLGGFTDRVLEGSQAALM